jgi:hypothetical protein
MDRVLRAVFDAVHAKVTFGNTKGGMGITSAVTVAEAFFAVGAKVDVAPYPKKRPGRKQPKKSTQGANRTAPESRQKPVSEYHGKKDKAQQSSTIKNGLLQIEPTLAVINRRKYRDGEGPRDKWNWIEQSDLKRTKSGNGK